MTTFMSLDAVAVGAPDFAKLDLSLSLRAALGSTDIPVLQVTDVVEVQRDGTRAVSTIHAACAHLVLIQPSTQDRRPSIGFDVDSLSIARYGQSRFPPLLGLCSVVLAWSARFVAAAVRAIRRACSLSTEQVTAQDADSLNLRSVLPGRHTFMLPATDAVYPCKPDIFEATYDEVVA